MTYDNELKFAKNLAYEAGKIMKRYFRAEDIGHTWKDDYSPLTIADTKINSLVIEEVNKHYPGYDVIGEEESYDGQGKMAWVVDPIDGTVPFSLGIPTSTFCLALVDKTDGQPKVGVVYDPFLDSLYSASIGEGAFLNGVQIHTSKAESLHNSYIGSGVGIGSLDKFNELNVKILTYWSYAYEAVKVASGDFTIAIITYGSPWDSAAPALIVKEAGGVATDLAGNARRYDKFSDGGILASNEHVLKEFLELNKR